MKKRRRKLGDRDGDENFIPGIYNYCDRWCERCPFTARCRTFAMEKEMRAGGEEARDDEENGEFWEEMTEGLAAAHEMLEEMCDERGIDFDNEDMKEFEEEERKKDERIENSVLTREALKYAKLADTWFDHEEAAFFEKEAQIKPLLSMGIKKKEAIASAEKIKDAVETICWHKEQIYVKLARALHGIDDEHEEGYPRDCDGSAKVALIGIDRALVCWARLRRHFPAREDELFAMLLLLERLRRMVE